MLIATALAEEGIPQRFVTGKVRTVLARSAGPPEGPSGLRVSARRQGSTAKKPAPGVGVGVGVGELVGVTVGGGVGVGVFVGVLVGVFVGVLVGVGVRVIVGVTVGVLDGVHVGVRVGVELSVRVAVGPPPPPPLWTACVALPETGCCAPWLVPEASISSVTKKMDPVQAGAVSSTLP